MEFFKGCNLMDIFIKLKFNGILQKFSGNFQKLKS